MKHVPIEEVIQLLKCEVLNLGKENYVTGVVASGLMSDVLTTEKEEFLLLTGLTTPQSVRTADMVMANAILFAMGKSVPDDTIELSKELGITLLITAYHQYEACVLLGELFPVVR